MRSAWPALLAVLLPACTALPSTHEAASVHAPVVYSCEDGLSLRVRFARDGAHVTLPSGEDVFLPQQAGRGGSYASAQHELTGQGERATWKGPRRVPVACRVQH